MKRRFEEILEECLSAQLEGRRSIEESLSLYPSLATELEPLLRTAEDVSFAFEELDPSPYLIERGRLRFVAASSEEHRARQITRGVRGLNQSGLFWNLCRRGMLASGIAAALGLLLVGAVIAFTGGIGDSGDTVRDTSDATSGEGSLFIANLKEFKARLNQVQLRALEGRISPQDLEKLRDATSDLARSGQPPNDEARQEVEKVLKEQYAFVSELADDLPAEQAPQVQNVLIITQKAANDLGVAIFPTPAPSDTLVPTPTPVASPTASDTPTPPATQTPAPTEPPQPTPTSASVGD